MTGGEGLVLRPERTLRTPRDRLRKALTNPQELAKWWPRGFTSPGVEFEPQVGCGYRLENSCPERPQ